MGQYYRFINLDKKEACDRNREFWKLTEHSYVGNYYCNDILSLINNEWKGDRVLHVGDYAEENDISTTSELIKKLNKEFNTKTPFYRYSYCFEDVKPNKVKNNIRYVYNLDKKEYIDLYEQPIMDTWFYDDTIGFNKLNSFALLTACGNGQGGGDYDGINNDKIGSWAGDHFESSEHKLNKYNDFKENKTYFFESWVANRICGFDEKLKTERGIDFLDKAIDNLKKYDRMPDILKVKVDGLNEAEKKELKSRNIKSIKIKDTKVESLNL